LRNQELKKARDKKIVEKFHELFDIKRMRMDDVLAELSEKYFFLDTKYIYSQIFYNKENYNYYNELTSKKKA
jgi:hypothetical protein